MTKKPELPANAPPNAPPSAPAKAGGDEDWDKALEEDSASLNMSPDMARALLSMNPALRDEGKNTAWVVRQNQSANREAQKPTAKPVQASKPQGPSNSTFSAQPKAKASTSQDVTGTLASLSQSLKKGRAQIDEEVAKLKQARLDLNRKMLEGFTAFLLQEDPKLLSPLTQQALQDNKALLDEIGFSIRYFSDQKQKQGR